MLRLRNTPRETTVSQEDGAIVQDTSGDANEEIKTSIKEIHNYDKVDGEKNTPVFEYKDETISVTMSKAIRKNMKGKKNITFYITKVDRKSTRLNSSHT